MTGAREVRARPGGPGAAVGVTAGPSSPPAASALLAVAVKPVLRGWLHAGMVPVVVAGGLVLLVLARDGWPQVAVAVHLATSLVLFTTSAVYHRGHWSRRVHGLLKRSDHANIYLLIAGTDTPLLGFAVPAGQRAVVLGAVWGAAAAGVAFRVVAPDAPRWLYTALYAVLGWATVVFLPDLHHRGGAAVVVLVLTGGVAYTAGGVVYALRRPDPWPRVAGFHEAFHLLTVIGWTCQYLAVALLIVAPR